MSVSTSTKSWYSEAKKAAKEIGWLPQVVMCQWQWETGHFKSNNLKKNNNIAGQTWYEGCGYPKGTKRPEREGGYYIKYPDPVTGYVDFIKKNQKRYGKVKDKKTVKEQFQEIKKGGWAVDPNYVNGLMGVHESNIKNGLYKEVSTPKKTTTKKTTTKKYTSIVDYLKDQGKPSDFISRRKLAQKHGISNYVGTGPQNIKLLQILQK